MNNNLSLKTGNKAVDLLSTLSIQGDIIPPNLYKIIKRESGKTDMLAVAILSNIIYWNRPTPVFDKNGKHVANKIKYHGDFLQKNYSDYAELYEKSKREVKAAFDTLELLGFIKRHWRKVIIHGNVIPNMLYIELIPDKLLDSLAEIADEAEPDITPSCKTKQYHEPVEENVENSSADTVMDYDIQFFVTPPTKKCKTNTNNNTKTNTNNKISFIPSSTLMDQSENERMNEQIYREIIADNIELETLLAEQPMERDEYLEFYEIIVDLVCHNNAPIKIRNKTYPAEVVKSQMLKLKREHIEYVADIYSNYRGKIWSFYNHCVATLYNSYFEASNSICTKARNNMYLCGVS